jgi:hypothetical protein
MKSLFTAVNLPLSIIVSTPREIYLYHIFFH